MAFNIGDTVGDYQIVGVLGEGGMGKVYKVRNTISDRTEAMKVLLPNLAEAPDLAERFMREIKMLASLNHPNIGGLHTALRSDNQLLMIMEFIEGRTLEERLREGPISLWESADYMSQALSALAYAHERGVVHRDFKPSNVIVTPEGQAKLMDFGIAKAVADRRLTAVGSTLGSLYYMSPEQVKGAATIDGRSDLYSVGVSLYEMVTGTRPFKGESDYSLMVAHLDQQPVPPIQLDPTLPPGLNEVILTAIQKDPENRFQTALAFRTALESIKQSLAPPVAKPIVAAAAFVLPANAPTQTARVVLPPPAPAAQPTPVPLPYAAPAPPFFATQAPPYAAPVPPAYAAPMPPPYAAPMPPPYAAPPPHAPAGSSHRGLWMALGGTLVVALLVLAAIYLPGWYRAHAGQPAAVVVDQQKPAEAAPQPAPEPAAQAPSEPATPAPAQEPAATPAPAPAPAAPASRPSPAVKARRASAAPAAQPVQATEPAPPPPPAPETPAAPQAAPPSPPPVDQAALDHATERLGMLSARANAARGTLQHLEEQQRKEGYGMRGDISASWKRLEYLLDQAEGAIKRQDLAAARRNLNLAERETDKLEQFLGR
jgi:serine/threonine-protein kinase